ncbi:hypothetical protein ONS95_013486 [Cadophora gregata]|uniref:uncharacterized protein n=1 Tax=Cadophora gregata TaxID=51156 RepID=UPI0026DBB8BB|nr:uncharacterized protein ONS95_013486 [Cadophora gregata]KAK0099617.1 hypothetical protein ONS96_008117 [Cadophora gregata f. sp. sojae]KAK0116472.1 hypothetical protein ONS95_013486 [Cadophora gregata]
MSTQPPPPTRTTFADTPSGLATAINSFFSGPPETTESDLSKFFTPTFTQCDDSNAPSGSRDFPAFVKHIKWLREILPPGSVNVKVTHYMRDGNQIAERHSGDPVTMEDGSVVLGETYMWIELAEDGRIEGVVETVRKMTVKGPTTTIGESGEDEGRTG